MASQPVWWHPARHEDRRPILLARGRIKSAVRAWFEAQGFVEVETGCLQVSPGNETHLHAFKTECVGTDLSRTPYYLHTSPEFGCKKLLAAGEEKIFTFAPVFRNRERGPLHASEFTMLEWYRADADYEALMEDCEKLIEIAADASGNDGDWSFGGRACDPRTSFDRVSVGEAFSCHLGVDLSALLTRDDKGLGQLKAVAQTRGHRINGDEGWSSLFSRLITEVEPELGVSSPTALYDYPLSEAALARASTTNPQVAERFEIYCCGIELANGFSELTDAKEQRARFEAAMDEKQAIYGERYPIDEDFLAAVDAMPEAAGCAMGFDRLVMLATGARHIDQVIWTPVPGAG